MPKAIAASGLAMLMGASQAVTATVLAQTPERAEVGPASALPREFLSIAGKVMIEWHVGYLAFCTGTLVGPRLVLTSAHCLHFNAALAPPGMIHFASGLDRSAQIAFAAVERVEVAPDFRTARIREASGAASDWALLVLKEPLSQQPAPVREPPFADAGPDATLRGAAIAYGMQHLYRPTLARNCRIWQGADRTMLRYDCLTQFGITGRLPTGSILNYGYSGAPLLVNFDGRPVVVGIGSRIAGEHGASPQGVGCSASQFADRIVRLNAELK